MQNASIFYYIIPQVLLFRRHSTTYNFRLTRNWLERAPNDYQKWETKLFSPTTKDAPSINRRKFPDCCFILSSRVHIKIATTGCIIARVLLFIIINNTLLTAVWIFQNIYMVSVTKRMFFSRRTFRIGYKQTQGHIFSFDFDIVQYIAMMDLRMFNIVFVF